MSILSRRIGETAPMSVNLAELQRKYPDLINLSIGDTDFTTDPRIIRAWQEDYGQTLDKKNVMVTASSCLGMGLLMLALIDPGDEVIVFGPYFSIYRSQIELAGGVCVEVPTCAQDGWALHEDLL